MAWLRIGDGATLGGRVCVVRGFSPMSVEPKLLYLEDVETGERFDVPRDEGVSRRSGRQKQTQSMTICGCGCRPAARDRGNMLCRLGRLKRQTDRAMDDATQNLVEAYEPAIAALGSVNDAEAASLIAWRQAQQARLLRPF
jgi:hypothetical protein